MRVLYHLFRQVLRGEMSNTIAAWVEAIGTWVTGGFTLLAVIWAIFHDRILDCLNRPKLVVTIKAPSTDCMKMDFGFKIAADGKLFDGSVPVYWLRLRVTNEGKRRADQVQVKIDRVQQKRSGNTYAPMESFPPMNLCWARQIEGRNPAYLPTIQPGTAEHCNLAHIFKPADRVTYPFPLENKPGVSPDRTLLSIDTDGKPYSRFQLLPEGSYRINLTLVSNDTAPTKLDIEITLDGQWYENEVEMWQKGVGVRILE